MPETVDLSPYAEDGVRDHPLSLELRVPIIATPHPRWCYITAIVAATWPWHESPEITDDEIRLIGSFNEEYVSYWYRQSGPWWTSMRARPFDIDGGAVGRFFTKYPNGGWAHRISTWQYGPTFVPTANHEPKSLTAVMDHVHSIGDKVMDRWSKWKTDHPELFGDPS